MPVTTVGGGGALTDAELRASPVKVDDDETQAALALLLTEATFDAKDFATEASLAAAVALLAALDVPLSTVATEATLDALLDWFQTRPQSVADPNNATTTPLGSAAVYTGGWTSTVELQEVMVTVSSDVPSDIDGVEIQFSDDAMTVKRRVRGTYGLLLVGQSATYTAPVQGDYWRLVYVNGAAAQVDFTVTSRVNLRSSTAPLQPIGSPLSERNIAATVRAVITGELEGAPDQFVNPQVTIDGELLVKLLDDLGAQPLDSVSGSAASIGTSAVQVASSPPANTKVFSFIASPDNTKTIYLGIGAGVTDGNAMWELGAGSAVTIPVDPLQQFWAIAGGSGNVLRWMYGVRVRP